MKTTFAIAIILLQCLSLHAQVITDSGYAVRVRDINPRYIRIKDSLYAASGICKTLRLWKPVQAAAVSHEVSGKKLLQIHGNVQYDLLYRSYSDTPFYQKDFVQHTLATHMMVTVKDKYPMQVNFVIRKSNSPYFRNFFDGGLVFDKSAFLGMLKEKLLARIASSLPDKSLLEQQLTALAKKMAEYEKLRDKLDNSSLVQEIIEERERNFFKKHNKRDAAISALPSGTDSVTGKLEQVVKEKKAELDSLKTGYERIKRKADSLDQSLRQKISSIQQRINKAKNSLETDSICREFGIENKRDKWERFVENIRSVGVGRSVINYSELTARDVSLTGLNIEYSNRRYYAFAAGKTDYGFRDFFGRNNMKSSQYLVMGRIGIGDPERRALIFSVFTGRKALYGSIISDTITGNYPVLGYSVEAIVRRNDQTFLSAEFAKSTRTVTGSFAGTKEAGNLFRFSDNSNLGLSIKGQTRFASSGTGISGFYRKTGEYFQSFSLFSYNTDQTAWMLRADQPLFKNRIKISGTLRKNDFVNPFTEKTFKTSTLFGSGHISIRFPGWPSVTAGYQPGSQLYIIDRNRVRENVYYMVNASVLHQYKLRSIRMVSSAMFNSYRSKGTDSGFINYNGRYYFLSQAVYFRNVSIQTSYIYTDQQDMHFYTLEGSADVSLGQRLRTGGGIKYNKIRDGSNYWGATAHLSLDLLRLGNLQLQYDKSYLPTVYRDLFPVEAGRLTWYKNF